MTKSNPRRAMTGGNRLVIVRDGSTSRVVRNEVEIRFTWDLIQVARYHALRAHQAKDDDFWEVRASVISAVCMAWASLESAYDEFIHHSAIQAGSPLPDEKREVIHYLGSEELKPTRARHLLDRFNMLLRVLECNELPKGSEPYQSADSLRRLRNELIHPKPLTAVVLDERNSMQVSRHPLVARLKTTLRLEAAATFPDDVLTPTCATWASQTAERFLQEFVSLSGVSFSFSLSSTRQPD